MTAALVRLARALFACPNCPKERAYGHAEGLSQGIGIGYQWGRSLAIEAYRKVHGHLP